MTRHGRKTLKDVCEKNPKISSDESSKGSCFSIYPLEVKFDHAGKYPTDAMIGGLLNSWHLGCIVVQSWFWKEMPSPS